MSSTIDPEEYSLFNLMQRSFAASAWRTFESLVHSRRPFDAPVEAVVDLGCGTGEVTRRLAMKFAEINAGGGKAKVGFAPKFVVGIDISADAVKFCRSRISGADNDSADAAAVAAPTRFEFVEADMSAASSLPASLTARFDAATSFCAAHWVEDQRRVLKSLRKCLKDGGVFLLLAPTDVEEIFVKVTAVMKERWHAHLSSVDLSASMTPGLACLHPWGRPDPAQGFADMAVDEGFEVLHSSVERYRYETDEEGLKGLMKALSPMLKTIPQESRQNFISEYLEEFKAQNQRREEEEEEKEEEEEEKEEEEEEKEEEEAKTRKVVLRQNVLVVVGKKNCESADSNAIAI